MERVLSTCLPGIHSNGPCAYRRIFPTSTGPPAEDIVGAVSCIIWSLTLIPLIKYSWIVLRAGDDQGEGTPDLFSVLMLGGTFVLYMLLSRYLGLDRHTPSVQQGDSLMLTITETMDSTTDLTGRPIKGEWIKDNRIFRGALLLWTLFGASCVIADGLLTPAVSVISAVAGTLFKLVAYFRYCRSCANSEQ